MKFHGKVGRNDRFLKVSGTIEEGEGTLHGVFVLPLGEHLDPRASDYRLTITDGRDFFIRIRIESGEQDQDIVHFKSNGPF